MSTRCTTDLPYDLSTVHQQLIHDTVTVITIFIIVVAAVTIITSVQSNLAKGHIADLSPEQMRMDLSNLDSHCSMDP